MRCIVIPATQDIYLQCDQGGHRGDLHRGGRRFQHADMRPVPGRPYGRSWPRRNALFGHHEPQLCRPYGTRGRLKSTWRAPRLRRPAQLQAISRTRINDLKEVCNMNAQGIVHKYGDNVDTDVIIPARYLNTASTQELAAHCMEDIDKEFCQERASRATSLWRIRTSAAALPESMRRLRSRPAAFPA